MTGTFEAEQTSTNLLDMVGCKSMARWGLYNRLVTPKASCLQLYRKRTTVQPFQGVAYGVACTRDYHRPSWRTGLGTIKGVAEV